MPIAVTAVAALAGALLFDRLKVPAGALIGAMVGVGTMKIAGSSLAADLPQIARFVAFAFVGWGIGQGLTREALRTLLSAAVPILATVVALLLFGALIAWLLVRAGIFDAETAFLLASPGALAQMAVLSDSVGATTSIVVTVHLLRVVAIIVLAPVVLRFLPGT